MKPTVGTDFLSFTEAHEGMTDYFYLDVKGLVSIGLGLLVDPVQSALGLSFVWPDGSGVHWSDVALAWGAVKSHPELRTRGGGAYAGLTKIRATRDSLDKMALAKLAENESILKQTFADFEDWPAPAQLATLCMAWAYGAYFTRTWPHFTAACLAQDWATAEKECHASAAELARQNQSFRDRDRATGEMFLQALTT